MKEIIIGGSHYRLCEPLGSGGMAEVFLAHDEILERDVALKILKEQYADNGGFVERFRREARSAASLNHPHIIVVYDWGRSANGTYCMAMEYASGGTLKDRIRQDGPLPPQKAVEVAFQIAQALGFAHERGVIHRDVKPHNVLLSEAGKAKVADFGIAQAAAANTTSRSNLILGTASYMSPEQAKGGRVSPASDLYSLGIVLYEMLTGVLPYEAEDPVALAIKHAEERPQSLREANPKVPEVLEGLTLRLLAKDPTDRYQNAMELLEDLRRVRDGLPLAFADAEPVATNRAVVPASSVPTTPGAGGTHSPLYAVYGGSRKLPLVITGPSSRSWSCLAPSSGVRGGVPRSWPRRKTWPAKASTSRAKTPTKASDRPVRRRFPRWGTCLKTKASTALKWTPATLRSPTSASLEAMPPPRVVSIARTPGRACWQSQTARTTLGWAMDPSGSGSQRLGEEARRRPRRSSPTQAMWWQSRRSGPAVNPLGRS